MIFFIFAENLTMLNKIGDWFLDIAKYITTAVIISSFLGGFEQKWVMYLIGVFSVILCFGIGIFLNNYKKNDKKIKK